MDLRSPTDLAQILGFSSKKLALDRIHGRGFPYQNQNGRIFYDLDVVSEILKSRAGQVLSGEGKERKEPRECLDSQNSSLQ
jgi:hypothetical protein